MPAAPENLFGCWDEGKEELGAHAMREEPWGGGEDVQECG